MNEFALFTDAEQMKSIFAQYLLASERDQMEILDCAIRHVWRKTYRKNADRSFITILYELKIADRRTHQITRQMLYAKAYLQHRSQSVFQQHVNDHLIAPPIGRAFTHLPALDMVVWAFPNDPAMPQLAALTQSEHAKQHLPFDALPACTATAENITDLNIAIVNYRPELRCTARYDLTYEANGKQSLLILFGKTFATSQGAEVFARMQALWDCAQANPHAFRIARPLSLHQATNTIWQTGLRGVPLTQIIQRDNHRTIAQTITKGLINLHASKIRVSNRLTPDTHLAEAKKKAEKLEQAFPHLQATLTELLHQLERDAPRLIEMRSIHGDFHVNQMLWSEGTIALFDFDECALGDPLQDVANFIADLQTQPFDTALRAAITNALIETYRQQSPQSFSSQRLNWHLRLQFLTRAYRCLWQQKPDLERTIRLYLQLAQRGCNQLAQAA